ncbi:hypothetical protein BU17DRAFT_101606 [Hysterangium stoloniferum]|nr:hypothetical protein BU17DRAFT_101606 [Hysterangium stoloniferum]
MAVLAVLTTLVLLYVAWALVSSGAFFHKVWSFSLLFLLFLTCILYALPTISFFTLPFANFALCLALSPAQVFLYPPKRTDSKKEAMKIYPPTSNSVGNDGRPQNAFFTDIVAVHGLASNPETTWETRKPSQVAAVLMVLSPFLASHRSLKLLPSESPQSSWLCDLLPNDIPDARIMIFSHNTAWKENALSKSLYDHGSDLLRTLDERCRTPEVGNDSPGMLLLNSRREVALLFLLATALEV